MLLLYTFLSLFPIFVLSTPVRTSLCCCGCLQDPCPVVGPSCGSPKEACDSVTREETVQCSELQRLWELAESEMKNGTKHDIIENDRSSPSFTPFLNEKGEAYEIHESGSKGFIQNVEVVNKPGFPLPSDSDFVSNIALPKISAIKKESVEIRRSPVRNVSTEEKAVKKLESMVNELQTMMDMVKGLMHSEVQINRLSSTNSQIEGTKVVDDQKRENGEESEMEKQVIDDVIRKMKLAFRKVESENKKQEESTESVTVSGDLMEEPHNRTKREGQVAKKEGNCNDLKLREIIMENIGGDAKTSKRLIQKAAEKEFGGTFNVICSPCEFSFVVSSQKFCEGIKDQIACFAFLQPPTTIRGQ